MSSVPAIGVITRAIGVITRADVIGARAMPTPTAADMAMPSIPTTDSSIMVVMDRALRWASVEAADTVDTVEVADTTVVDMVEAADTMVVDMVVVEEAIIIEITKARNDAGFLYERQVLSLFGIGSGLK